MGPIVVCTGDFAERPLTDKFIVKDPVSEEKVSWGDENKPLSEERFDNCFGATSLTLSADVYGSLLMEKIKKHDATCWLLNTGWLAEPRGTGERIKIAQTRKLIHAAVSGKLNRIGYETDPIFSFEIPKECPGVPAEILNPRRVARNQGEYEFRAVQLAKKFMEDFARYEKIMPENMRSTLLNVLTLDESFDMLEAFNVSI